MNYRRVDDLPIRLRPHSTKVLRVQRAYLPPALLDSSVPCLGDRFLYGLLDLCNCCGIETVFADSVDRLDGVVFDCVLHLADIAP